jgi:branched-chain amino acid transport system permease protein
MASVLVGLADTVGRAFVPDLLHAFLSESASSSLGRALSSMMVYLVMALVLIARPEGLFPAAGK